MGPRGTESPRNGHPGGFDGHAQHAPPGGQGGGLDGQASGVHVCRAGAAVHEPFRDQDRLAARAPEPVPGAAAARTGEESAFAVAGPFPQEVEHRLRLGAGEPLLLGHTSPALAQDGVHGPATANVGARTAQMIEAVHYYENSFLILSQIVEYKGYFVANRFSRKVDVVSQIAVHSF